MNKLSFKQLATSEEQYPVLKELGISETTADMKYMDVFDEFEDEPHRELVPKSFVQSHDDFDDETWTYKLHTETPAWSQTAMMNILPNTIVIASEPDNPRARYEVQLHKYQFTDDVTMYQISYGNCFTMSGSWKAMVTSPERENMIDCIISMLQWIKDNNFIDYYAYKNSTKGQTTGDVQV